MVRAVWNAERLGSAAKTGDDKTCIFKPLARAIVWGNRRAVKRKRESPRSVRSGGCAGLEETSESLRARRGAVLRRRRVGHERELVVDRDVGVVVVDLDRVAARVPANEVAADVRLQALLGAALDVDLVLDRAVDLEASV